MSVSSFRTITVSGSPGVTGTLSFYPPTGRQARHEHDHMQISFLLSGELLERHTSREWTAHGPSCGLKPPGVAHDNEWGRSGALIFCLKLSAETATELGVVEQLGWQPNVSTFVARLIGSCVREGCAQSQQEAMIDLIANFPGARTELGRHPPPWLAVGRDRLRESPTAATVAELAAFARVNRAHYSREFTRFYGLPPSLYRRHVQVSRALARIALSRTLFTEIAHEEGFSDQAHLSRSVLRATGLTPRQLRAALG